VKCYGILRQILGISQQTVCDEVRLSRQTLSAYENGHDFPTRYTCRQLDQALEAILDRRALAAIELLRSGGQPAEQEQEQTQEPEAQAQGK
jgi:transcriptional regulator with XRE-family HTH domain